MVYPPPAYLFMSVHLGPLLNLEGSSLLSLFLSFSLPLLASLLFLPPMPLSFLHQTTLYCYCQTSSTFFNDMVSNDVSTTISMMSLKSQVMQLLDLLISHEELNDINVYFSLFNHRSGCSLKNLLSSRQHVSYSYLQIQYLLLSDPSL